MFVCDGCGKDRNSPVADDGEIALCFFCVKELERQTDDVEFMLQLIGPVG